MIYILFLGMAASGIAGRVNLLSHRAGWLRADNQQRPLGLVFFELITGLFGVAALVVSFLILDWWWPLIALAVGFWLIGPIAVSRERFAFFYQIQPVTHLVSFVCSVVICAYYFKFI